MTVIKWVPQSKARKKGTKQGSRKVSLLSRIGKTVWCSCTTCWDELYPQINTCKNHYTNELLITYKRKLCLSQNWKVRPFKFLVASNCEKVQKDLLTILYYIGLFSIFSLKSFKGSTNHLKWWYYFVFDVLY